ncbi:MAG TPA: tetratricopeptide repeat protein, partial [Chloroflexia bacterium]
HGMGGIGKTALAAEAAAQLRDEHVFENGVLWVSNVGSSTVEGLCDTIARLMKDRHIPELAPSEKPGAMYELLSAYKLLIVFDDVLDPQVALDFAERCAQADDSLLVTSRIRNALFNSDLRIVSLEQQDSINMFSELAHVGSDHEEYGLVPEICEFLGYHPLALVVAAALMREEDVTLKSLKERLSSSESLLASLEGLEGDDESSSGRRNVRASLKLSYDALPAQQQHVFTHLAACFGESTGLELLADICGLSQVDCERRAGRLVAWSLAERSGGRFSMHPLVKDFGRGVLRKENQLHSVQESITAKLITYVQHHMADSNEDYLKIALEITNLLGALDFAKESGLHGSIQDLSSLLLQTNALDGLGYWAEYISIGRAGLESLEQSPDEGLFAELSHNLANMLDQQGNLEEASDLYQQSLATSQKLGNQTFVANTLHQLGIIEQAKGNLEEAKDLYQQSLAISQELGSQLAIANTLHQLGILEQDKGNLEEAKHLYQQSLAISQELGNQSVIASTLHQLGSIEQIKGNLEEASDLSQQSLAISQKLGNQAFVANTLHQLGILEQAKGNLEEAKDLYQQSLAISQKLGNQSVIADTLHQLGSIEQAKGNLEEAKDLYQQSLAIDQKLGNQIGIAISFTQLGDLAVEQGDRPEARSLFQAALEIFERLKLPQVHAVRERLARLDEADARNAS